MERWWPIKTARLLLREIQRPDEDDVHEYASDPCVSRFDSCGPNTREKTHEVITRCASWRVMEKLGMRREAHFVKDAFRKGEWRDSYLYAILADEWLAGKT